MLVTMHSAPFGAILTFAGTKHCSQEQARTCAVEGSGHLEAAAPVHAATGDAHRPQLAGAAEEGRKPGLPTLPHIRQTYLMHAAFP